MVRSIWGAAPPLEVTTMKALASAVVVAAMFAGGAAQAATVSPGAIGTTFTYDFAKTHEGVNLSAVSLWKLTDYTSDATDALWTFQVDVTNTTVDQAGDNRLTIWGFDTDPESSVNKGDKPASDWFFAQDSQVPGLSKYQICANSNHDKNCSGGGGDGLSEGAGVTFNFTIKTALADPLKFTSLFVRYQSVGHKDGSIAFVGVEREPVAPVPLPAAGFLLLGGLGALGLARRRKAA